MNNNSYTILKKRLFIKSILLLSFIIIFIVVWEIFLRIWLFYFASADVKTRYFSYNEINVINRQYSPHHYLNHYLTPNYISLDGLNRHNSLGYRGEEITIPKPKGIFRIAVLGGSSIYTEMVRDFRKSFTVQLQRVLRDKYGYTNVEVVNAGVGGYTSWESLVNLEFRVLDIDPDLLIIYHGANDVHARLVSSSLYRGDNFGLRKQWSLAEIPFWERSVLFRFIASKLNFVPLHFRYGLYDCVNTHSSHAGVMGYDEKIGGNPLSVLKNNPPIYFERNLRNMIAIAKEYNIQILFATWAYSPLFEDYASTQHYQLGFKENNEAVRNVTEKHIIQLFDFVKVMPSDKRFWHDGRHVNEEGALLKANLFAEFLLQ